MKYNILVEGPYLTQSGYGEHARLVLDSLKEDNSLEIYGLPLAWGQTSWLSEDNEERNWLDEISLKSVKNPPGKFDLHVFVGMPVEFTGKAPRTVCVTAGIEVDRVDPQWLIKSYEMEKIIVPSNFSKAVFLNSSYKTEAEEGSDSEQKTLEVNCPISVVPYHVRNHQAKRSRLNLEFQTGFNFLTVAQWGERKNLENTIGWFVEEFKNKSDVGLVVKTSLARNCNMDYEMCFNSINQILDSADPEGQRKCKVYLLHGDLTRQQMSSLYKSKEIKALLTATHGEGFGLPVFEAVCNNLPVVATNATGHLDFLYAPDSSGQVTAHFAPIEFSIAPVPDTAVWDGVVAEGSRWAYPEKESFREQIRAVYDDHEKYQKLAKKLNNHVVEEFSKEKVLSMMREEILSVMKEGVEDFTPQVFD